MTTPHPPTALTPRQREIAALVAAGRTNAEIGGALGISGETVRNHLAMVMARLRMANRAQLAAWYATATIEEG